MFQQVFHPIILSVIFALVLTQILKLLTHRLQKNEWNYKKMFADGGMPSAHTAVVMSMATAVFLLERFSTVFFVTLIFAIVIMRDAFGIRWQAGEHAKLLNQILKIKNPKDQLKEILGHTPLQVFMGAVVGIISGIIVYIIMHRLDKIYPFLT